MVPAAGPNAKHGAWFHVAPNCPKKQALTVRAGLPRSGTDAAGSPANSISHLARFRAGG